MTTWREEITESLKINGESWSDVIGTTLTDFELDVKFNGGYGSSEGKRVYFQAFTLWTHKRVYFPVVYDGAEWIGSVPRNPCDEATCHIGGQ